MNKLNKPLVMKGSLSENPEILVHAIERAIAISQRAIVRTKTANGMFIDLISTKNVDNGTTQGAVDE